MRAANPSCRYRHADHAGRPPAQARNTGTRVPSAFTVGDQLLWGAAEPLLLRFVNWRNLYSLNLQVRCRPC